MGYSEMATQGGYPILLRNLKLVTLWFLPPGGCPKVATQRLLPPGGYPKMVDPRWLPTCGYPQAATLR